MKTLTKVMIVLGLLTVLISSMMVGCGKNEGEKSEGVEKEKAIVGKWKEIDGTQIIEFFKDGTVSISDEGQSQMTGEYKFIAGKQIRMMLPLFGAVKAELSNSKDEISLVNPFGKAEKYWKLGTVGRREEIEVIKISEDDVPGEYISKYNKKELITINKDGTFKFIGGGDWGNSRIIMTGEWDFKDNQIRFYIDTGTVKRVYHELLSGEIKRGAIYSKGGSVWTRKKSYIVY